MPPSPLIATQRMIVGYLYEDDARAWRCPSDDDRPHDATRSLTWSRQPWLGLVRPRKRWFLRKPGTWSWSSRPADSYGDPDRGLDEFAARAVAQPPGPAEPRPALAGGAGLLEVDDGMAVRLLRALGVGRVRFSRGACGARDAAERVRPGIRRYSCILAGRVE
jgi:hypothetical protein